MKQRTVDRFGPPGPVRFHYAGVVNRPVGALAERQATTHPTHPTCSRAPCLHTYLARLGCVAGGEAPATHVALWHAIRDTMGAAWGAAILGDVGRRQ